MKNLFLVALLTVVLGSCLFAMENDQASSGGGLKIDTGFKYQNSGNGDSRTKEALMQHAVPTESKDDFRQWQLKLAAARAAREHEDDYSVAGCRGSDGGYEDK